jgi:hypothetical protein
MGWVWAKECESTTMQPMFSNSVDSVLEKRIKQLRRAFRRQLHTTKATTIQQALIDRAARLTAIAEAMAEAIAHDPDNPDCKPSALAVVDNRAEAARREMFMSFGGKPDVKRVTLADIRRAGAAYA